MARGPLRAPRVSPPGVRTGTTPQARRYRRRAGLRSLRVGGSRLERLGDRLLPRAGRDVPPRLAHHARRRADARGPGERGAPGAREPVAALARSAAGSTRHPLSDLAPEPRRSARIELSDSRLRRLP